MVDNTLVEYNNGDDGDESCLNQYVDALSKDLVPRDVSGIPNHITEDVGDTATPPLSVKLNGAFFRSGTLTQKVYSSSDTFTVPANCYEIYIIVGGAGGTPLGNLTTDSAGAGGGVVISWLDVTPLEVITITIAAGVATFGSYASAEKGEDGLSNFPPRGGAATLSQNGKDRGGFAQRGGTTRTNGAQGASTISGRGGRGLSGDRSGGGAGYAAGGDRAANTNAAGGGYTAAAVAVPGDAGIEVRYYVQDGVTDPN